MASEKEIPSEEILEYARQAFGMPKAGPVALLRIAARRLHIGKVEEFQGSSSRLLLTAIKVLT